ncbi:MAG: molybdopterin molybdotransferase MoeA [Magnetococcales bacterium]|nr:molybdopterin molybdotransferase MoeA [Magnetococcales bacterium]
MIDFAEARERVMAGVNPTGRTERIEVIAGLGRVLAMPVIAPLHVPNHDNSAMDGYGVRLADLLSDQETTLTVVADLPAGDRLEHPLAAGEAVRIMTGAPIPAGCDCVVMQEVVRREGQRVAIPPGQRAGQNVRRAGEDIRAGAQVLEPGRRLSPADLGLLTSLGFSHVTVTERLRVAVLSTGNEVQAVGSPLQPGHVYDSNRTALKTALEALGVTVIDLGLARDDREQIQAALNQGAATADAVITTGGVSVGDYDLVKEILSREGRIDFWKVAMKPGKPQAYGQLGRAAFFGLPGNPVSCLAVFLLMVRPALLRLMGGSPEPDRHLRLPLRGRLVKKHGRMDFQRGVVHFDTDGPWVESTGAQGSGILTSMSRANAFIVLPSPPVEIQAGELVDVWLIDYA